MRRSGAGACWPLAPQAAREGRHQPGPGAGAQQSVQGRDVLVHRGDRELQLGRHLLVAVPPRRPGDRPLGAGESGPVGGCGRDADRVTASGVSGLVEPEGGLGAQRHAAAVPVGGLDRAGVASRAGQVADERLQRDRHLRREGIRREQADPALPRGTQRHETTAVVEHDLAQGRARRRNGTGCGQAGGESAGQRRRGTVEELELAGRNPPPDSRRASWTAATQRCRWARPYRSAPPAGDSHLRQARVSVRASTGGGGAEPSVAVLVEDGRPTAPPEQRREVQDPVRGDQVGVAQPRVHGLRRLTAVGQQPREQQRGLVDGEQRAVVERDGGVEDGEGAGGQQLGAGRVVGDQPQLLQGPSAAQGQACHAALDPQENPVQRVPRSVDGADDRPRSRPGRRLR